MSYCGTGAVSRSRTALTGSGSDEITAPTAPDLLNLEDTIRFKVAEITLGTKMPQNKSRPIPKAPKRTSGST